MQVSCSVLKPRAAHLLPLLRSAILDGIRIFYKHLKNCNHLCVPETHPPVSQSVGGPRGKCVLLLISDCVAISKTVKGFHPPVSRSLSLPCAHPFLCKHPPESTHSKCSRDDDDGISGVGFHPFARLTPCSFAKRPLSCCLWLYNLHSVVLLPLVCHKIVGA